MRYEKGHKDTTRKRIVTFASKRFRRHGAKATGVASVMGDAGLTHGGFYAYFGSKEELLRAAVAEAVDLIYGRLSRCGAAGGLEAMVRDYLGEWHIAKPERGCAFAALMPEIARSSPATRRAVAEKLEDFFDLIAEHLAGALSRRDEAGMEGQLLARSGRLPRCNNSSAIRGDPEARGATLAPPLTTHSGPAKLPAGCNKPRAGQLT